MTSELISINKKPIEISPTELPRVVHPQYNNLILYPNLSIWEEIAGFILEVYEELNWKNTKVYPSFLSDTTVKILDIFLGSRGITLSDNLDLSDIVITEMHTTLFLDQKFVISFSRIPNSHQYVEFTEYNWEKRNLWLYIRTEYREKFEFAFKHAIYKDYFDYENLIHLVMIVKNAGEILRTVIQKNIPYIDRWTILDTGSTDNTMEIIMEELHPKVKGKLFQEPFKNFRDSRNRALELAGKVCTFLIMLDDTYELRGSVRDFLQTVRSDQFADSYSLYIQSADIQYTTNRILRSQSNLRYIFKMHEVIQKDNNSNVMIPIEVGLIWDHRSPYMEARTQDRKKYDLQVLLESILEEPNEPRHLYYTAQTYNCLGDRENAHKYYLQRFYHSNQGFVQEKIDAGFEAARLANFYLNKSWEECKLLYEKCFELDKRRPDSLYFIGIHHYTKGDHPTALIWFKKAFQVGYPIECQFGLKPTLSFYFLPKLLVGLCINSEKREDWKLALDACELFFRNPTPNSAETPNIKQIMINWYGIYKHLIKIPENYRLRTPKIPKKPIIAFVADGNWNPWTGRDIETKGMGGSETHVIRFASSIQNRGIFDVLVFCRCSLEEKYQGVQYLSIDSYEDFIYSNKVNTVVISRYTEYIPVTCFSEVENIFVFFHDLIPNETVLYRNPKIKNVFCLTEWHKKYFDEIFPSWSDISTSLHYGIDDIDVEHDSDADTLDELNSSTEKPKSQIRFIYSSFANRGLLVLLEMWRDIRKIFNTARLDIFCDVNHEWTNRNYPIVCLKIKSLLHDLSSEGIYYHGWVGKKSLYKAWNRADIWLYPCTFKETFCLTALEAARTKTLAITCDLAALQNTVGDRGILISGDPNTIEWRTEALSTLSKIADNLSVFQDLVESNYKWSLTHTWTNQADIFLEKYVMRHRWEYGNKFNWTTSTVLTCIVPHIVKSEVKSEFPHILEINPFSGTSVIKLTRGFQNPYIMLCGKLLDCLERNMRISRTKYQAFVQQTALLDIYRDQNYFNLISIFYDTDQSIADNYVLIANAECLLHKKGLLILNNIPNDFTLPSSLKNFKRLYDTNTDGNMMTILRKS